ncbi:hypothetical protein [Pseudogemmobacter bohemicus]|uniref:hypothetical protein n=1 Tax=Pseudogemmobacter bohemicus TaxID=2250708 RepID=UPI000DD34A24|nr:hypothetical protein [Pseudogemmobacter bohemicus]
METGQKTPGEAQIPAWLQPQIAWGDVFDPGVIFGSLRCEGDDGNEVIQGFAETFGVDLTGLAHGFTTAPMSRLCRRRWRAVDPETGAAQPFFPISLQDPVAAAAAGTWNKTHPPCRL